MEETKVCNKCGKEKAVTEFCKGKNACKCKECYNAYAREYRKTHPMKKYRYSEYKTKKSREVRAKMKEETGRVYRNEREAERMREYSRNYAKNRVKDEHYKEVRRKCHERYQQRKKMKEEVEILNEFFNTDFSDIL